MTIPYFKSNTGQLLIWYFRTDRLKREHHELYEKNKPVDHTYPFSILPGYEHKLLFEAYTAPKAEKVI